jgi:hypothetical protein
MKAAKKQRNQSRPTKRWKRVALWLAGGLAFFVLLALLQFGNIVRIILRHELIVQSGGLFNASLKIDDLSYRPLLSVHVGHARLLAADGTTIIELGDLDLNLAKLPRHLPVIVNSLIVNDPVIHLTRLATGELVFQPNLLRPQPPTPASKFSDVLQIHDFQIKNLTIEVTDQTQPGSPIETWAHIGVTCRLSGGQAGYSFNAELDDRPLAHLVTDGSFDLDKTEFAVNHLKLSGRLANDATFHQLPRWLQEICRRKGITGVGGDMTLAGASTLDIDLDKNHWNLSATSGNLKLNGQRAQQKVSGKMTFYVVAGGPIPSSDKPFGLDYINQLDPETKLTISTDPAENLSIVSPDMPQPITNGDGTIQFHKGSITIRQFGADFGTQKINLTATFSILPDRIRLEVLRLAAANGEVQITQSELGLNSPHRYKAFLEFSGIDLAKVKELLSVNDPKGAMIGLGKGRVDFFGDFSSPPLRQLTATGAVRLKDGNFFTLPVLGDLAQKVNPGFKPVGQVGDGGAVFTVDHGVVHMSKIAVSSPLLGVQGYGDLGIKPPNALNLKLVIAPLGDWKEQLKKTGIPLISQIAGTFQQAIDTVSQKLLYNFHVTGTVQKPSIEPIPAPILTKEAKALFRNMIEPAGGDLFDLLQPSDQQKSQ